MGKSTSDIQYELMFIGCTVRLSMYYRFAVKHIHGAFSFWNNFNRRRALWRIGHRMWVTFILESSFGGRSVSIQFPCSSLIFLHSLHKGSRNSVFFWFSMTVRGFERYSEIPDIPSMNPVSYLVFPLFLVMKRCLTVRIEPLAWTIPVTVFLGGFISPWLVHIIIPFCPVFFLRFFS